METEFKQDLVLKRIDHFVFPVGTLTGGKFELKGTAFFIGSTGVAVTAAHVVDDLKSSGDPVGIFPGTEHWFFVRILNAESHPSEDVALLQLRGAWHSIIEMSATVEHSSLEYELWGYPERVAHELRKMATNQEDADNLVIPSLIYNRGYVRRRIGRQLPVSVYRGQAFYELSEVGGSCCSGAPIIKKHRQPGPWPAFGIYIGEETGEAVSAVGYATRCDALKEWRPKMIDGGLEDQKASIRS